MFTSSGLDNKDFDDEEKGFKRSLAMVNHPFPHIATRETEYDVRKAVSCRPQNVLTHEPHPFRHKNDPIKLYNESMYRLGGFAPPRR